MAGHPAIRLSRENKACFNMISFTMQTIGRYLCASVLPCALGLTLTIRQQCLKLYTLSQLEAKLTAYSGVSCFVLTRDDVAFLCLALLLAA